jgi:hypothetical protein
VDSPPAAHRTVNRSPLPQTFRQVRQELRQGGHR